MNAIAIPTHNRPALLQQTMNSIFAAVGSNEWTIMLCPESSPPRGCRLNTHEACRRAISNGAEWVLYLEDDVVLAKDALLLCKAFIEAQQSGILCLRRWHDSQQLDKPNEVAKANHGLLGDGFLFHCDAWQFLSSWWFRDEPQMGGKMWDWSVSYGLGAQQIQQWRPFVNRSRNIGAHGTHSTSAADLNHFGPCYDGTPITEFVFTP